MFFRKYIEREVERRLWEETRRKEADERVGHVERRLAELEMQLYDVRMKADPEFRKRNTPVCGVAEREP